MAELEPNASPETKPETKPAEVEKPDDIAEIARLKSELAKQISKNDALAKENADQKKALRAKQTAEEIAAEEKRAQDEEKDRKLAEYEKRLTVSEASKKIMGVVGDEALANDIASSMYGAESIDGAIAAFTKAWKAKEASLRNELGKIPLPGVGSGNGATITKKELDEMGYLQRVKFANENPTEYNRLMGRTT